MDLSFGVDRMLAPLIIDLIGRQNRLLLRDHRIAGDHKTVGLVIVDKGLAAEIDGSAMRLLEIRCDTRLLCAR